MVIESSNITYDHAQGRVLFPAGTGFSVSTGEYFTILKLADAFQGKYKNR